MNKDLAEVTERVVVAKQTIDDLLSVIGRRLVGQSAVARKLVMGLIAEGHVLLEGLPGLAKTTAVKALGEASDMTVSRIQFTPDLLPADIIGTQVYDPRSMEFKVKTGPIFANLVIADEINRAPAKVQAALLEAMQERQVTIGDQTFKMQRPFLVMATQNPIEQEGTYTLPEAQTDRFLLKVQVDYLQAKDEIEMMSRFASGKEEPLDRVIGADDIIQIRDLVNDIHVSDKIREYIISLVFATRNPAERGFPDLASMIAYGASPRASLNLERASRVAAIMDGRAYVAPQDVKDVAADILRHRILPSYEAEADNISSGVLVEKILNRVDVP